MRMTLFLLIIWTDCNLAAFLNVLQLCSCWTYRREISQMNGRVSNLSLALAFVNERVPSFLLLLLLLLPLLQSIVQPGLSSPLTPFTGLVLISSHEISLHLWRPRGAIPPLWPFPCQSMKWTPSPPSSSPLTGQINASFAAAAHSPSGCWFWTAISLSPAAQNLHCVFSSTGNHTMHTKETRKDGM